MAHFIVQDISTIIDPSIIYINNNISIERIYWKNRTPKAIANSDQYKEEVKFTDNNILLGYTT